MIKVEKRLEGLYIEKDIPESDLIVKNRKKSTNLKKSAVYTIYLTSDPKYIDLIDKEIDIDKEMTISIDVDEYDKYYALVLKATSKFKCYNENGFAVQKLKEIRNNNISEDKKNVILKGKIISKGNKREIQFIGDNLIDCLVKTKVKILIKDNNIKLIPIYYDKDILEFLPQNFEEQEDDGDLNEYFEEGEVKILKKKRKNRNNKARNECKKIYIKKDGVLRCQICGLKVSDKYGIGYENMIEIHHINPMSKKKGKYIIDPKTDLIPVCANCHSIIHAKKKAKKIEEVKKLVNDSLNGYNHETVIELVDEYKKFLDNER